MEKSLDQLLREFAKINGLNIRCVSWEQAQADKQKSRQQDREDIASGRRTAEQVTIDNSGGLDGARMVIRDKSPSYR